MYQLRILLVEDDSTIAATLTAKLEALGHDVCAIDMTEGEAVVSACRFHPDLVIIDPWLGDGSGHTELERHGNAIPQLFLSSDISCVEETHPGAVVVGKTCREDELARAIRRVLSIA